MLPETILLIDDDISVRESIRTVLEEEGYHVQLAQTASEGLEKMKIQFFDLILLDYLLPDMNGIETFEKIKELPQVSPVIIITGYGTKEISIEALRLGAFDFIEKPLHREIMVNSVTRCLQTQKLLRKLAGAEKEHAKFIALAMALGTTHTFNNYLTIMSGNLQLLERACSYPDKHEFLRPVKEALLECQQLTRQIKHTAKVSTELEPLDINHLIQSVISSLRPGWEAPGIEYTVTFEPGELPLLKARALEMEDIFTNLILNSLEATPEGGEIIISTGVKEDQVFIRVKDTGPGIPEEIMPRLFEPFITTKKDGQGLGLFLVRHILWQYGGRIKAESQPGQGASFTVWLPLPS